MLEKTFKWFVNSSVDPSKFSLTLKAGIPFLALLGIDRYVASSDLNSVVDSLSLVFAAAGTLISGLLSIYGFIRKIRNSFLP